LELCALGLLACFIAVQPTGAAEGQKVSKLRVLIFSGLNNHDWRSTTPAIEKMFVGCDRFGPVDVIETPADLDPGRLASYDVIVSNWTPYPDTRRTWRPELESAFLEWIRAGGGFVVIHAAACTFQEWPDFQNLIAITWKDSFTAHSAYHTFNVSVDAPEHPIARGLTDFLTTDELYHNMVALTDHPRQIVFQAFSAKEQAGTGKYEPVVVCTEMARGRGVNVVLGHDAAAMGAGFKTLLLRSAEWAATGQVTISPPAIWPTTVRSLEAAKVDIDENYDALTRFTEGQDPKPWRDLQQLIRYAISDDSDKARGLRVELERRMIALLASSDATVESKARVCRQFSAVAREDRASVLAALLTNAELAGPALQGLTVMPGATVDALLRGALEGASGEQRIGIINALGERRDSAAVGIISQFLSSDDEALSCAAAATLGKIGGDNVLAVIQPLLASTTGRKREAVADACLACADRLRAGGRGEEAVAVYERLSGSGETEQVRTAAWRGIILARPDQTVELICAALTSGDSGRENAALSLLADAPGGPAATVRFAACIGKSNPSVQVPLIAALAARRDPVARDAIEYAVKSPDAAVRLSAWKALGVVGGETSVRLLAEQALASENTPEVEEARRSLIRLPDAHVNDLLAGMLTRRTVAEKVELIRILAARNARTVVDRLKHLAVDADENVRLESWKALEVLAQESDGEPLLKLLMHAADSERDAAEAAVIAVLKNATRPDVGAVLAQDEASLGTAAYCSWLRILSAMGDDRALPAMRRAIASSDVKVRDAAVRGLAAWPTPAPFDDLMTLSRTAPDSSHRVVALRGAVRLSRLAREQLQPANLALGATASSPDGIEPDGVSGGDQAAIDGNPGTYWDEVDNAEAYCLKVTFREPTEVSSINILWHPYEQHQAKNLDVLCDEKVVAEVRETPCVEHEMFVPFPVVRCTSVELRIPGKNGLISPAIHEFQIFGDFPLISPDHNAPQASEKAP
jgi:type 1 glutamine amidotransferase/HEAT repeat protein